MRRLAQESGWMFEAAFASRFGTEPAFDPGFGRVVDFGIELLGGYSHRFVASAARKSDPHRFFGLRAKGPIIDRRLPAVAVLHGWRTFYMLQAAIECRRAGVPFILRAENPIYRGRGEHRTWRSGLRDILLRWLLRSAAVCVYIGTANRRFFLERGVPAEKLVHMPYYVDNEAVLGAAALGKSRRAELRASLGIPAQAGLIACVGKFLPRKRQRDLVEAMQQLPAHAHALFIGSGEQEQTCRNLAAGLGIADRCHFAGFRPSLEAWEMLGACDVFCLPSAVETWGLVVNEASAAGLPVVVTDEVGCAEDLVVAGRTGSVVAVGNIAQLSAALREWTSEGASLDTSCQRSLVDSHSIDAAIRGFKAAVEKALRSRG
jgi:glycosyltransferase involved in cell wall biosynthesis